MRARAAIATLSATAVLPFAGCGDGPPKPADAERIGPPLGFQETKFPKAGLSVDIPDGWHKADGTAPLVVSAQTGAATVAVWRYPRTEVLPQTHHALLVAKDALVGAVKKRDPTFALESAKLEHVNGKRAVELIGTGTVAGLPRRLRSTHVYSLGAEYVVDAFAPLDQFARVNAQVFERVSGSLQVAKPEG